MKLKSPWFSLAAATAVITVTATVSPAQAAQLSAGSTLNIASVITGGVVTSNASQFNFFGPSVLGVGAGNGFGVASGSVDPLIGNTDGSGFFTAGASTGSFASVIIGGGLIKDLSRPTPTATQSNSFLRFSSVALSTSSPLPTTWQGRVDLSSFTQASPTLFTFTGNAFIGGFDPTPVIGQLTLQTVAATTTYSLSVTAIPTPALLPGLIGFGLAALRKKQKEQVA